MEHLTDQDRQTEEFVRLLTGSQREILRYILALVPNVEDANEILQETAVALWQRFDRYDPDEPFTPWACRFAFRHVLKFREREIRRRRFLSVEAAELIHSARVGHDEILEARRRALGRCIEKLGGEERQLVDQRYLRRTTTVSHLAEITGRDASALYRALERVRRHLFECVNRTLKTEGLL